MNDLKGSLQTFDLPSLIEFLGQLRKTGSLSISDAASSGSIFMESGRVVGAVFGSERGLSAFEAIVLMLGSGEFDFVDDTPERELNLLIEPEVLDEHLRRLAAARLEVKDALPSLSVVPTAALDGSDEDQLPIDRGSLRLLFDMDGRLSVLDLARGRSLVPTARRVAHLVSLGLARVDAPRNGQAGEMSHGPVAERPGSDRA